MNEEEVKIGTEEAAGESKPEFADETLVCVECGKEFVFSAGEQAFYKEKGYTNKPKRCRECRMAKKNPGQERTERTYYYAVCDDCGGEAKIPFEPTKGKPAYCSTCHEKHMTERRKQRKGNK